MFCSALTNICAIALLWLPLDCFGEEPYDRKEKGGFLALLDLCIYIQNRYGKQEISRASIPIVFLLLTYTGIIFNLCCLQYAFTHQNYGINTV